MDNKGLKRFEADLRKLGGTAYPIAVMNTLNTAGFEARTEGQKNIRKKMVLRNTWTVGSVQVERTKTKRIRQMGTVVGSRMPGMEDQEFGGVQRKKGKAGKPIPTPFASNEPAGTRPRRRLVAYSGTKHLRKIKLHKRKVRGNMSPRQKNLVKIRQASEAGAKNIYLKSAKNEGIYRITGHARRLKSGKRSTSLKLKMVHSLKQDSVRIPPRPWLIPAMREVQTRIPAIHRKALRRQLLQLKSFRG